MYNHDVLFSYNYHFHFHRLLHPHQPALSRTLLEVNSLQFWIIRMHNIWEQDALHTQPIWLWRSMMLHQQDSCAAWALFSKFKEIRYGNPSLWHLWTDNLCIMIEIVCLKSFCFFFIGQFFISYWCWIRNCCSTMIFFSTRD